VNPLASVSKVDQTIKTRVRRALTDEELIRLLESSPHYRRVPYLMSARTGLRYGELSELVWRDITLNGENSHVLVRASISKKKGGPHPFDSGMGGITR
jgi:integrase